MTRILRVNDVRETFSLDQEQMLLIDGKRKKAASREAFEVIDPATGRAITTVSRGEERDIDTAVIAAREAFESGPWSQMRPSERGQILNAIAAGIRREADRLAALEGLDVGKPLSQAYNDVEAAARYFEFYAGMADKFGGSTIPLASHLLDYTLREPIGVSGQIIPFNYPLQNTARGGAPALAMGCTVVLKPSPEAPLSPLIVAEIALRCGLPDGVLNVVPGGDEAGAALASHAGIDQVTFTGSVATGISVAQAAAANIVPSVLELGGKSPSIVFGDTDTDRTVSGVMGAMFSNAGQACAAGTRLLLQRGDGGDQFLQQLIESTEKLTIGCSADDPDIGPLVSASQRDKVEAFVGRARDEGAVVLTGGARPREPDLAGGYFYTPTLCAVEDTNAEISREEVFGPVLTVIGFDDLEEACALANDTTYGLSSYVWTRDIDNALTLASRIRAGQVNVNTFDVGTGAELPFGGFKKSGWGREKGIETLLSYTELKNVCVGIKAREGVAPGSRAGLEMASSETGRGGDI